MIRSMILLREFRIIKRKLTFETIDSFILVHEKPLLSSIV